MSQDFILPDIGEGIVECEVVEWLISEGDTVAEDQPICDVMTDKALVQIPAVHNGVITKLYYQKGEIAKVHEPLFAMDVDGAAASSAPQEAAPETSTEQPVASEAPSGTALEDFILPDIGEGIVECEIVDWLVAEGDEIKEDQAVCDVMTDKALVQIPAKHTGRVTKLYHQKGEIAKVHAPLFQMQVASAQVINIQEKVVNAQQNASAKQVEATPSQAVASGKAVASPAVRRLAREHNIDIAKVDGSGKNGRVYKDDIKRFLNDGSTASKRTEDTSTPVATQMQATRVEPIRGMQAAMAKQMMESVSTIPHFTLSDEIDLTELISLRKSLKEQYAKQGVKVTMMPFFIKALSLALKEFPVINSQVNADCTELTYFNDHNIGMAVDSKLGLLVPNIKSCQAKNMVDIANEVSRLTEQAREGRVTPADLKGGTISISNIGAIGGTTATPIINKPEVAIVALGKLQHLPRFNEKGEVESRAIMQISWSGDHRIIDGATMARFNNLWKHYLETPSAMLMAMS
ncbi:Dihydrolipoyllysine-residue acetyltransferase component of pyruvate dehydrogenase complex [Pseudoalteromonas sp. P1-9]|uniref:dihydrolipoyllysine-residue acetyltransferase n=1 Tax=Pseudoalteromonas sp. P1-9 TaxID=1710354 RepID=UPI0006D62A06|nr:dihydrolipoyllysine-residue acetyltransferase [Pseudoalteromonas sp. P1-9]KPV95511.1 Dihydrolipoyllysine-residue acetyltransferase component of pyruvate dehydrogenase complex [Pseudoalteromonas sp. P1-9]